MRKIYYNLAGTRKIDARNFALRMTAIFLAVIMFNAVTFFNLARQQRQSRDEKTEIRLIVQKLEALNQKTLLQQKKITDWKKKWQPELAMANLLIERKCFSFIYRLNFLEKVLSAGMSVNQLGIVNEPAGRVRMTIGALAQNELLGLYKKLLPYALVINSENQTGEKYQANLSFGINDEEI